MIKLLARIILKIAGWSAINEPDPAIRRSVVLAVPHTSNWDYLYAMCFGKSLNLDFKVAIKHYWTRFPFSIIIKPLGGLGIKRGKERDEKVSQVDMMAELFETRDQLALIIAPEGSRKLHKRWKAGYYHVAHNAQVPLLPVFLDYTKKQLTFGPPIDSSGTRDEVMGKVMDYYNSIDGNGKYPEKFSLDERFLPQE